jgi:hypothetical protein
VSRTGDIDLGLVIASMKVLRAMDLEQFGMERPAEELKRQFSYFGSYGKHGTALASCCRSMAE